MSDQGRSAVGSVHGRHVVVVGPMGIGKSTLGVLLADRLQRLYRDSDSDISRLYGESGGRIAAEHGVNCLHEIERAVLLGALTVEQPLVVSAAASVVESPLVQRALHHVAFVVVLEASVDVVLNRLAADNAKHRRLMSRAELAELLDRRAPMTAALADITLDARLDPAALADAVLSRL